jgi:hypothetical protein
MSLLPFFDRDAICGAGGVSVGRPAVAVAPRPIPEPRDADPPKIASSTQ